MKSPEAIRRDLHEVARWATVHAYDENMEALGIERYAVLEAMADWIAQVELTRPGMARPVQSAIVGEIAYLAGVLEGRSQAAAEART